MKRDMNLIREMLLKIEEQEEAWAPGPNDWEITGYTEAQIAYHTYLLVEAGFARGDEVTGFNAEAPECLITNMTWKGHEFLAAAKNDTIWEKAMAISARMGGGLTMAGLKELLIIL